MRRRVGMISLSRQVSRSAIRRRIGEFDGRTVRLDQIDDALLDPAGHDLRRRTACDTRLVSGRQFHTAALMSEYRQLAGARPIQAGFAWYSAVLETGVLTPVRSSIATGGRLRGEVRRDETLCCQGPDTEARSERAEHCGSERCPVTGTWFRVAEVRAGRRSGGRRCGSDRHPATAVANRGVMMFILNRMVFPFIGPTREICSLAVNVNR